MIHDPDALRAHLAAAMPDEPLDIRSTHPDGSAAAFAEIPAPTFAGVPGPAGPSRNYCPSHPGACVVFEIR
jgi:hypothetical protein